MIWIKKDLIILLNKADKVEPESQPCVQCYTGVSAQPKNPPDPGIDEKALQPMTYVQINLRNPLLMRATFMNHDVTNQVHYLKVETSYLIHFSNVL